MSKLKCKKPKALNNWDKLTKKIKINVDTGCWEWTGYLLPNGYSYICVNYKKVYLHMYSYAIHKGVITDGMSVLHKCDNRKCCNPEHLFLGTQKDNMDDMWNKGRGASGDKNSSRKHPEKLQGERNGMSKLCEKQIIDILEKIKIGTSCRQIAIQYKVCNQTICNIKNGKLWKKLTRCIGDGGN